MSWPHAPEAIPAAVRVSRLLQVLAVPPGFDDRRKFRVDGSAFDLFDHHHAR
jgi:hypothetical protein